MKKSILTAIALLAAGIAVNFGIPLHLQASSLIAPTSVRTGQLQQPLNSTIPQGISPPRNYHFRTGPNWSHTLGQPTQSNNVRVDESMLNIRRDRNVSSLPPSYGTFSVITVTDSLNRTFDVWVNWIDGVPVVIEDPNRIPIFDTLRQGVNSANWHGNMMNQTTPQVMPTIPQGNPSGTNMGGGLASITNTNPQGNNSGFLPPTSVLP
ncbi:MAG: hypothetical protein FWG65_13305 [Turicibacter sp.]|nr:hypothetical protein [Turicibacter sp.]